MSVEMGMGRDVGEKEKVREEDGVREEWEVEPSRERRILTAELR